LSGRRKAKGKQRRDTARDVVTAALPPAHEPVEDRFYNPVIMRRWPIAILTLHFFASVVLFAFGPFNADARILTGQVISGSDASGAAPTQQHTDQLDITPDHGLTDGQPDLPDTVQAHVIEVESDRVLSLPSAAPPLKRTPPTLEGLQRPPCASAIA
jgi:hypothetical protein